MVKIAETTDYWDVKCYFDIFSHLLFILAVWNLTPTNSVLCGPLGSHASRKQRKLKEHIILNSGYFACRVLFNMWAPPFKCNIEKHSFEIEVIGES